MVLIKIYIKPIDRTDTRIVFPSRYGISLEYTRREYDYLSHFLNIMGLLVKTSKTPFETANYVTINYFQETDLQLLKYVLQNAFSVTGAHMTGMYLDSINGPLIKLYESNVQANLGIFRVIPFQVRDSIFTTSYFPITTISTDSTKILKSFILNIQHAYDIIFGDSSTIEGIF